jgi:hypothetical protein
MGKGVGMKYRLYLQSGAPVVEPSNILRGTWQYSSNTQKKVIRWFEDYLYQCSIHADWKETRVQYTQISVSVLRCRVYYSDWTGNPKQQTAFIIRECTV